MPANSDPIFSRVGSISAIAVTAANTSSQGGGTIATDIFKAFTADATNGGLIQFGYWILCESTINTASTATVGRVFISSVSSGATTSTDTWMYDERALASQTPSSTVAGTKILVPFNFAIDPGFTILVTNHAAPAANTHWKFVVVGGKY